MIINAMKAYQVHDGERSENCLLVFANSNQEAKKIGYLVDNVGSEGFITLRASRLPDVDSLLDCEKDKPYVVKDDKTLRLSGFHLEGDDKCSSCGLAEFDGEFPVCESCGNCAECGCDEECNHN